MVARVRSSDLPIKSARAHFPLVFTIFLFAVADLRGGRAGFAPLRPLGAADVRCGRLLGRQ